MKYQNDKCLPLVFYLQSTLLFTRKIAYDECFSWWNKIIFIVGAYIENETTISHSLSVEFQQVQVKSSIYFLLCLMKHFYELAMKYKLFFILLRGWRIYFMVFNYILYRGYIFWWGLVPFIEKTFVKVACYLRNNDPEKSKSFNGQV